MYGTCEWRPPVYDTKTAFLCTKGWSLCTGFTAFLTTRCITDHIATRLGFCRWLRPGGSEKERNFFFLFFLFHFPLLRLHGVSLLCRSPMGARNSTCTTNPFNTILVVLQSRSGASGCQFYSRGIPYPGLTAGRRDRRLVQRCTVSDRVREEKRLSSGEKNSNKSISNLMEALATRL